MLLRTEPHCCQYTGDIQRWLLLPHNQSGATPHILLFWLSSLSQSLPRVHTCLCDMQLYVMYQYIETCVNLRIPQSKIA